MPKSFNFYGGPETSGEALARALDAGTTATTAAGAQKAESARQAALQLQRAFEFNASRRDQAAELAQRERLVRFQQEGENARQRSYQEFQGHENQLGRESTAKENRLAEEFNVGQERTRQGFEKWKTGQQEGLEKWVTEARIKGALQEQREKAQIVAAEKAKVDAGMLAATQYAVSPEGQKQLYITWEPTGLEALELANLPKSAMEAEVIRLFPTVAPKPGIGLDAKEDRSALDAKLADLKQKFYVQVPNKLGFEAMKGQLLQSGVGAEGIKAIFNELVPDSGNGIEMANGPQSAWEAAKKHVRGILTEVKAAGQGAQVQGGLSDVLNLFQKGQETADVNAPPQAMAYNQKWLEAAGANPEQLSVGMKADMALPHPMELDESGHFILLPDDASDPSGPIPVAPGAQQRLDEFMEKNPTIYARAIAMSGTPGQKRSPGEAEDMGTRVQMQGRGKPVKIGEKTDLLKTRQAERLQTKGANKNPTSPGMDALDKYRERVKRESSPGGTGGGR